MRNMHYKAHSFRISEDVLEALKKVRPGNLSWNLLFKKILAGYEKSEKDKKKKSKSS